MSHPVIGAAALLSGVVLLAAGVPKALRSTTFAAQLDDYGLLPRGVTRAAARIVSSAETVSGGLLLTGLLVSSSLRQGAAAMAAVLFGGFLVALASAHRQGRKIACACFGGSGQLETVGPHSLVRTGLLLVLALIAALPAHTGRPLPVIAFAAVLAVLIATASELARLFGPLRQATNVMFAGFELAAVPATEGEADP
jgi:Methylamine utilisation protein MauE